MAAFPFRLGTTSYILPDDILPNVRYLAGQVQDVELVLFELDDGAGNLLNPAQRAELRALAADYDLTYTIHLPLDLRLADNPHRVRGGNGSLQHISLEKAQRVIETTLDLEPWAFVLHLDGTSVRSGADKYAFQRWQDQAVQALEQASHWVGSLERLAVENLEGYPPHFNQPVFDQISVSRCVDVGHLWLDGVDPLAYLRQTMARTRVVHLHGISGRDHCSLTCMQPNQVHSVINELIQQGYQGVLTLEVFSQPDFLSSMEMIRKMVESTDER